MIIPKTKPAKISTAATAMAHVVGKDKYTTNPTRHPPNTGEATILSQPIISKIVFIYFNFMTIEV